MSHSPEDHPTELNQQSDNQFERLKRRLADFDEGNTIEREQIGDSLGDIERKQLYQLPEDVANDLLSFYITTSAMIEQESVLIINAYAFDFGVNGRGSMKFLEEHLNQYDREEMLYCLGLIDSGLKGELARVRRRRNELAHSQRHDEVEDIDQVENDIKRAKDAKDELKSIGVKVELEGTGMLPDEDESN